MSDPEKTQQALRELWDIVRCRCHEAYTGRGLHDPDCECDSADAVKVVADRIEQLVATNKELKAVIDHQRKRAETLAEGWRIADDARVELEAKLSESEALLAKAVEALDCWGCMMNNPAYDLGEMMTEFDAVARTTLRELTGDKDG